MTCCNTTWQCILHTSFLGRQLPPTRKPYSCAKTSPCNGRDGNFDEPCFLGNGANPPPYNGRHGNLDEPCFLGISIVILKFTINKRVKLLSVLQGSDCVCWMNLAFLEGSHAITCQLGQWLPQILETLCKIQLQDI